MEIIYCGGGNKRFAEIAIKHNFRYGARIPNDKPYFKPYFIDHDWKSPNRRKYMKLVSQLTPQIATVLDLEHKSQIPEVFSWAEELSPFVKTIVIIPKIHNIVSLLPRTINQKEIRLGYSVPTKYGGTNVMLMEFCDWPVHLLGGAPHKQFELAHYLNVVSIDGNMHMKMATQKCAFFDDNKRTLRGYWPQLKDIGLEHVSDAPYKAFELSCVNIINMWTEGGFIKRRYNEGKSSLD